MAEVKQWWEWMEEAQSLDGLKMVDGEQASRWQEVKMVVDLSIRDWWLEMASFEQELKGPEGLSYDTLFITLPLPFYRVHGPNLIKMSINPTRNRHKDTE
ncbi:hypothetical protein PAMA_019615 [Pampus argenteus]